MENTLDAQAATLFPPDVIEAAKKPQPNGPVRQEKGEEAISPLAAFIQQRYMAVLEQPGSGVPDQDGFLSPVSRQNVIKTKRMVEHDRGIELAGLTPKEIALEARSQWRTTRNILKLKSISESYGLNVPAEILYEAKEIPTFEAYGTFIDTLSESAGVEKMDDLSKAYMYSVSTGKSGHLFGQIVELSQTFLAMTPDEKLENAVVTIDGENAGFRISTSLNELYGEDHVVARSIHRASRTKDTPLELFIPIHKDLEISPNEDLRSVLLASLDRISDTVIFDHGFGAGPEVIDSLLEEYVKMMEAETMLISIGTKGTGGTVTGEASSMDRSGYHVYEVAEALGSIGIDRKTVMVGHSMGGLEVLLSGMFLDKEYLEHVRLVLLNLVVSNNPEDLTFLNTLQGLFIQGIYEMPKPTRAAALKAGEIPGLRVNERLTEGTLGVTPENRDVQQPYVDIHYSNVPQAEYIQSCIRNIKGFVDGLSPQNLTALIEMLDPQIGGVLISLGDKVLRPQRQIEYFVNKLTGDRTHVSPEDAHYARPEVVLMMLRQAWDQLHNPNIPIENSPILIAAD